ncbi:MAG: vitamin B12-dependent ribonucleotide reductase [Planctomycetia bacterium]|nr:vitamin B12-dependent ribonucleotide reductase [Planctomycetia bacterium]
MNTMIFCPSLDPFETVRWTKRTATIRADDGSALFELSNCEFPEDWSQLAVNIVASKYFTNGETSLKQLIYRVCRTIADWGLADGYFETRDQCDTFYRELTWLCLHQYTAFNSPVWFNVGLFDQYGTSGESRNWRWDSLTNQAIPAADAYQYPQTSACFIQSVDDTMDSIMDLAKNEATLFKYGSGTGTNLSTLRSSHETLSNGGKPSGPLSFMRVYDQIAAVVKSGGKTRRAAKMQILNIDHPDIVEFIECKTKEEEKAKLLMQAGLSRDDAYSSVLFQNANLSVRLTNEFMQAVQDDEIWTTHFVTDPSKEGPSCNARDLFHKIAHAAWSCGDPGLQFDDTIDRWNTCSASGHINASNPCSEYLGLDNSACNLASLNLMKFRNEDGTLNEERFQNACRIIFTAQDILIDRSSYPTREITENSHNFRPIGLGYTNLGALLMANAIPYDSDEARTFCSRITSLLQASACLTSAELAARLGPFTKYEENRIKINAVHQTMAQDSPLDIRKIWKNAFKIAEETGYRNSQFSVLAPTGTISFMMDCDTTGIEPDIALVKYKQLTGGGTLKMVNRIVPLALKKLGYSEEAIQAISEHIAQTGSLENAPHFKDEHLTVFDCAFAAPNGNRCLCWQSHIKMMAAAQPFISGAISKTVNMPHSATVEDIEEAYTMAWRLGLKSLAVYRGGSKTGQPLNINRTNAKKFIPAPPKRERLPDLRPSLTHKFSVSGHEGYLHVGLYPDGRVGEIFIKMAKEGSTIGGLMDSFATALSLGLQYGVPLHCYIDKFTHVRFEPTGFTKNPDIPIAKSLVDYIFRWLEQQFIKPASQVEPEPVHPVKTAASTQYAQFQSDAPACDTCGAITVRSGSCYLCHNCGRSLGCS